METPFNLVSNEAVVVHLTHNVAARFLSCRNSVSCLGGFPGRASVFGNISVVLNVKIFYFP